MTLLHVGGIYYQAEYKHISSTCAGIRNGINWIALPLERGAFWREYMLHWSTKQFRYQSVESKLLTSIMYIILRGIGVCVRPSVFIFC